MADDGSPSNPPQSKPLFAAASLFPSAGVINHERDSSSPILDDDSCEEDNLESMKLELDPSTLSAIIEAQQQQIPDPQTLDEKPDENETSSKSTSNESDRKRKLPWLSDTFGQEEKEGSPKHKKRSKDKHKKKKKHKDKKRRHNSRSPSPEKKAPPNVPKIPVGAVFLDDIKDLKPEHAFRVDKKSNRDLWHYESISKHHIAKYKTVCQNCLGASHIYSQDKKVGKKDKRSDIRYYKKEGVKQIRGKASECLPDIKNSLSPSAAEFIKFPGEKEDKQSKLVTGSYSCLDDATLLYIQGKDASYSKQPDTVSDDVVLDEIYNKVRKFNQRTREEPENVSLWLEFVQFQDVVAQEDKSFKGQTINLRDVYQPSKSVIEKKLAILDKARETNPSSLELKLAQLELYQDLWEPSKLEKSWEELLFVHAANVELWRKYLSMQQSRLFKFSFSRVVKCYHKCFKTLIPILDRQVKALNKREDMEEKMIGLFFQYCNFLHHTGYTERAVSSYQAMIELNLFCPPSLNLSTTRERVQKFEDFWESGVPRFGEKGAQGWTKWVEKPNEVNIAAPYSVSTEEQEDAIVSAKRTRAQSWLEMEKVRQDAHWLPWRPDTAKGETDDSCEDLDRLVLLDDISPAIFRLTKSESCVRIVCLFLKFLGLPSEILNQKLDNLCDGFESAEFDQYSCTSLCQIPQAANFKCGVDADSKWRPHDCLLSFLREVIIQAEGYFSMSKRVLFTLLRIELEILKTGVHKVSEMSKSDIKELKKFGKNLLKESQNRSNLTIWDSYIRLLWACSEKMAETMSMTDTALAMFMGSVTWSDPEKAVGLCLLCQTYCQIMLNFEPLEHIDIHGRHSSPSLEDKHQVIACLGALVETKAFKSSTKTEITPAYVLKIRKRFQTLLDEFYKKMEQRPEHSICDLLVTLISCFALFEFSASNFKAANSVYVSSRKSLKDTFLRCIQKENLDGRLQLQLYLLQISFITNVMHISIIPLTDLRRVIFEAFQDFPDCPHIHATFLRIESGAHIANRLRKYYERHVKLATSTTVPLFAVVSEMMRHQAIRRDVEELDGPQTAIPDSGIVHRVRATFDHVLQSRASSHCPLLWRLCLMFEAKYGDKSRAKGIFYRGLQNCPWAKCLYLDGIAVFGDTELQEVMDLMTEEELRVRMPMEEVDLLLTAEKDASEDEQDIETMSIADDGEDDDDMSSSKVTEETLPHEENL